MMPLICGLLALAPALLLVVLLGYAPPPSAVDIRERTKVVYSVKCMLIVVSSEVSGQL